MSLERYRISYTAYILKNIVCQFTIVLKILVLLLLHYWNKAWDAFGLCHAWVSQVMAGRTSDNLELARVERTIQNSESAYGHLSLRGQASFIIQIWLVPCWRNYLTSSKNCPISATQAHLLFLYGYNSAVLFKVPILDVYLKLS